MFVRGPNIVPYPVEGVARLIAYIHRNPVRAGLVTAPADTDWTSHRAYLGLAYKPSWLDVNLGLQLSSFRHAPTLDAWVGSMDVTRDELEAMRNDPRKPAGRRRDCVGTSASRLSTPRTALRCPGDGVSEPRARAGTMGDLRRAAEKSKPA